MIILDPLNEQIIDASDSAYPSRLEIVTSDRRGDDATTTTYGFVVDGACTVRSRQLDVTAKAGSYFCFPGKFELKSKGTIVLIKRLKYVGQCVIGSIESTCRLSYMDGSTASILVAPPRKGDPVLNHIHFPNGVNQTVHTHPTIRFGIVFRGCGVVVCGDHSGKATTSKKLTQGAVFMLAAHERHAFQTLEEGEELHLISFHPDSDWGPTDEEHPVLSRTQIVT